ncbi:MAG TPA: Maf family protein [Acidimicrobiia bacterium]
MKTLVLASGSPRRAELLSLLGVPFQVDVADVDESRRPGEEPATYVERLARAKASAVAREEVVALGADTIVVHHGVVLGKPAHPAEARSMLKRLSGDAHQAMTAVAVAIVERGRVVLDSVVETALVRFLPLTDREIDDYLATGEPLDKAGAYALQGRGAVLVESIEGHPTTVVGLPLPATRRLLVRAGVESLD